MTLENALSSLENNSLWFCNPKEWQDPFERRFVEASYKNNSTGKITKFPWLDKSFCCCMTQTTVSEAFWNAYSNGTIGISFRFYRDKLLGALKKSNCDIYIGKVEYMKTNDIEKDLHLIPFHGGNNKYPSKNFLARLMMLKRIAFSYEDEIRIIIVKNKKTKSQGFSLNLNCMMSDLVKSIYIDPKVGDNTAEMLKETLIRKYNFSSLKPGEYRVMKSNLYTPKSNVTINI